MRFEIKEGKNNAEICFEVSNLITLCPHRVYDKEDMTEVKLTYKPGKSGYMISKEDFKKYIEDEVENHEIAMEIIPLKILNYLIQRMVMRKPASRYASPEYVEVKTVSRGKGKSLHSPQMCGLKERLSSPYYHVFFECYPFRFTA